MKSLKIGLCGVGNVGGAVLKILTSSKDLVELQGGVNFELVQVGARKGKEVEREPRFIRVTSIEMLAFESPKVQFRIECSKGTYVRTIAHDLGQKIGCGAYLATLRRTAIERFRIEDAISLKELESTEFGELHKILIPV